MQKYLNIPIMSGKSVTGSHHDFSGTHTPMMDSSCEFVNIGDEDIEDARVHASALASDGQLQILK